MPSQKVNSFGKIFTPESQIDVFDACKYIEGDPKKKKKRVLFHISKINLFGHKL